MEIKNIYYGVVVLFIFKIILDIGISLLEFGSAYFNFNIYILIVLELILAFTILYLFVFKTKSIPLIKPFFFIIILGFSFFINKIGADFIYNELYPFTKTETQLIHVWQSGIKNISLLAFAIIAYIKFWKHKDE